MVYGEDGRVRYSAVTGCGSDINAANGPASSSNTPPSSDSGVHSWNEQWENISENSTYNAAGQTVGSDCESSGRVHLIEIHAPPNTEEEGDSDYPWTDRLLSRKLDGSSSEVVYGEDGRVRYSAVTGCGVIEMQTLQPCQTFLMTRRRRE